MDSSSSPIFRTLTPQPSACIMSSWCSGDWLTTWHLIVTGGKCPPALFISLCFQHGRVRLWTFQLFCARGSQRALCGQFQGGNGIDLWVTCVNTKACGSEVRSLVFGALEGKDEAKVFLIFTANWVKLSHFTFFCHSSHIIAFRQSQVVRIGVEMVSLSFFFDLNWLFFYLIKRKVSKWV